jgi:hypothetical protein
MLVLLSALALMAQNPVGVIVGTVNDPSGLPIADVPVVVTNLATGQTFNTKTNATGDYLVRELPPGEYSVSGSFTGFKKIVRSPITLQSFQNARVDLALQVGTATDSVVVTAEVPQVDTRSNILGAQVDNRLITEMPVQDRNIVAVVNYTPGVQNVAAGNNVNRNQQRLNIGGNRAYSTNMQYDGASMYFAHRGQGIAMPAPDSIQEVKVITSGVTAEYGRGTAVFAAVTKSGGNAFHGTAWDFIRNDAFNSMAYFTRIKAGATKSMLREHDFGGTIGGPIIKNRLFFFASYQGLRLHQVAKSSSSFTPTQEQRQGLFLAKIKDPSKAGAPYFPTVIGPDGKTYYQIPSSRFDPVSVKLLGMIAPPDNPNGTVTLSGGASPVTGDGVVAKFDYVATQRDQLSFRWYWDYKRAITQAPSSPAGALPGYSPSPTSQDPKSSTATYTRTWTPSLLTTTRASLTKFVYDEGTVITTSLADLGATNFVDQYQTHRLPTILLPGYFSAAAMAIDQRGGTDYGFSQDWSLAHGAHEIKWGGLVERIGFKKPNSSTSNGEFTFDGTITGDSVADFLLGTYQQLKQNSGSVSAGHYYPMGFYGQDTWKAKKNLTLTLGLRWDIYTSWRENKGQEVTFIPGVKSTTYPNSPLGTVYQTDPEFPYHTNWKNFGPRVGFAWDVFGDGRTAVRGGYGISYDPLVAEPVIHGTQPYSYSVTNKYKVSNYLATPALRLSNPYLTGTNPFPYVNDPNSATFKPAYGVEGLRGDFQPMNNQNVSLTVERQLSETWSISSSYVGNFGRHGYGAFEGNPAVYYTDPVKQALAIDMRRIYSPTNGFPNYASMPSYSSNLNSSYHALQAVIIKRPSHGLSVMAHYTWSRGIDQCTTEAMGGCGRQNPFNAAAERSAGDYDRTHNAVITWIYELPKLSSLPRALRQVVGGWQVANYQYFRSGTPYTIIAGKDISTTGVGNDRPNLVGDPNATIQNPVAGAIYAFNPAAFAFASAGQYGNVGRNTMRAPFDMRWDASLKKVFYLGGEKNRFEIRADATNLLNHDIFDGGTNTMGPNLGVVTATVVSGRTIRLGAHLEF